MEIILMRHGQTQGNVAHCYSGGGTDEPLTAEGERLALAAGVHPDVAKVYVTPLLRTQQTARICFPNAAQTVIEGLSEMHFGAFEGRTADAMADDPAYRAWVDGNCEGMCPGMGGESIATFATRVYEAFSAFMRSQLASGAQKAVLVVHGGTITALLKLFADPTRDFYHWFMPNCGGYRVTVDEKTWPADKRFLTFEAFDRLPDDI